MLNVLLMPFSMMNVIHLILLCEFVSVGVIAGPNNSDEDESLEISTGRDYQCTVKQPDKPLLPLDHVKIRIIDKRDVLSRVNLRQTKRVLANKHLRVWILDKMVDIDTLDEKDGHELERDYEVMKQLGEFTAYHEPETSSAAIYFHKRREIDGMIGYEFLIQKLSIGYIRPVGRTSLILNQFGVYRRPKYVGNIDEEQEEDPGAGVNYQSYMKTYGGHVNDGYPEVLVIVSWDVANYMTRSVAEADHYTTIVSNVLTLFNGIDMLYSKLKKSKIQINIAGIIIGTKEESFYFLDECYHFVPISGKSKLRLGGRCAISHVVRYLDARKKKIPIDSYDMALFLTRDKIVSESHENLEDYETPGTFSEVNGISGRIRNLYECRKQDSNCILCGIITTRGYLDEYPTIAHEMAHLMTVSHDKQPHDKINGKCCRSLMKTSGEWCGECLSWSDISEETFNLFFSSPNCCTFVNEPRSLYPSGRKQMLTEDEQCRCYGYISMRKYSKIPEIFCQVNLQCITADDKVHDAVIPMDGTPCDKNKVCWQTHCDDVEVTEQSDQQNVM